MISYNFFIKGKQCKVVKNFAWKRGSYTLRRQYVCKFRDKERDGSIISYYFNQQSDGSWTCVEVKFNKKDERASEIHPVRVGHFEVDHRKERERA